MTRTSLISKIILLGVAWWSLAYFAFTAQSLLTFLITSSLGFVFSFLFAWDVRRSMQPLKFVRLNQPKPLDTKNIKHQEFLELANQFNSLLIQQNEKIESLTDESREHVAIFNSMMEGILAIDTTAKIKYANPAAIKILHLDEINFVGKPIEECVRNPELLAHLEATLKQEQSSNEQIPLYDQDQRWLQVQASPLRETPETREGTIVVFSDITPLRKLENLRKEFVANVSHELRTPLTSIHGFAETLMKNPGLPPDQSRQFLDIISRQSQRLSILIDDLLSLSKIEQSENQQVLETTSLPLKNVIDSAVSIFNNPRVKVSAAQNPTLAVNTTLLEQACVNLIENALRYGGTDSPIEVLINADSQWAQIAVRDFGPGIPAEHLPRLFERFYRVDRARSQKLGGTGLGLAIVKHIALAHKGRVEVQSELKKGTTFTIFLPLTQTIQA